MTNFDFLLSTPDFVPFAQVAISAEKLLHIDADACVLNCRRAMEFAVKFMYSVDRDLVKPDHDNLINLMNDAKFRDIVGQDVWMRMDFIRRVGNNAAHGGQKVTPDQAELCLENLYAFLDQVAYFYASDYTAGRFDRSLLELTVDEALSFVPKADLDLNRLIEENKTLREQLSAHRAEQQQTYVPEPLARSEYKTRKIYIDFMLQDAGWVEGRDWLNGVKLCGMPDKNEVCYADHVLFGDDGKPLAVLEVRRTCADIAEGRKQARLYADLLEKQYGRRPVIFLSDGFETRILDGRYAPERRVSSVYSKRDLQRLFDLHAVRTDLENVTVDKTIAGRYYQEGAVKAVCEAFGRKDRRKALLVMAAGSGKTRTVIALCKVLLERGWVKNILFLADRNSLVTQAKRSFADLLSDLSAVNLCEDKGNSDARCVFSTYQTMMDCIDTVKDENGRKRFTVGHFDLVIVDEAHRSVYDRYKNLFRYFDALLVGLTAAPEDEIDKSTYGIFELENGVPTYSYALAQAVKDGFLVDFTSVESKLKFVEQGIAYDELSDADREAYENGKLPERMDSSALREWICNDGTIRKVLHILMQDGLRIEGGKKLGKTILFAKDHEHAEKIHEIFCEEYPHLPGYTKVIDNFTVHAQSAIDDFSDPKKLPQIAISVDVLDTGIDVPEVLNLVFFKRVMSKAKFRQMIGRGTRRCDGLMDGKDKDRFYIFDFCGNFEFFRMNVGKPADGAPALQGKIFRLKAQLVCKLQGSACRTDELIAFRKRLVDDLVRKVCELNKENFAVRQHLRYVEQYANPERYDSLTYEDMLLMAQELAPLIMPDGDDVSAVRFDALLYGLELAHLTGEDDPRARTDLCQKVGGIAKIADVPEITAQSALIGRILQTDHLANADVNELERIREHLRGLMKYLPHPIAM